MRRALLMAIMALPLALVSAQIEEPEPQEGYTTAPVRLLFRGTFIGIDLDELNRSLTGSGYEPFENITSTEGILALKRPGSKLGTHMAYIRIGSTDNNAFSIAIDGGTTITKRRTMKGWGLRLGFDYYLKEHKLLKLYIPLSLQMMKYRLTTFEDVPVGFQFPVNTDITEHSYTSFRNTFEVGINLETGIRVKDYIYIFGINSGYRFDPGSQDWKFSDEIGIRFPEFRNQGFFLGFSFGLSGARAPVKPRQM